MSLEEVLKKYLPLIKKECWKYTKNKEDFEDVCQNVFYKICKNFDLINQSFLPQTLKIIVRNEGITFWKRNLKHKSPFLVFEETSCIKENYDFYLAVESLLDKFDSKNYISDSFEGYSLEEISKKENISIENLKTRMFRLRKDLKNEKNNYIIAPNCNFVNSPNPNLSRSV